MKGKYGKLVFYLETCESGSMFQKLPNNTGIYGLSAASPTESSWGTYCSPDDVVQGKHVGSCLGDLFSVNFIEDLDKGTYNDETLNDHFILIKRLTSLSHVMQWGDLSFQSDRVGEYVSGSTPRRNNIRMIKPIQKIGNKHTESAKMNSRTMKLQSLSAIYARDHSA
jgi:legumain